MLSGVAWVTPAQIIYYWPLWKPWNDHAPAVVHFYQMTEEMTSYVLTRALQTSHSQVRAAYGEEPVVKVPSNIEPCCYVLVRNWKRKHLDPHWDGPFQVILTTTTAANVKSCAAWVCTTANWLGSPIKRGEKSNFYYFLYFCFPWELYHHTFSCIIISLVVLL